ncbi:MAG: ABC transporter ATP-binding protein [Deltaproteobacteria bacterium]|nr:ABC transporter ATP-binding protein [Deltaproteobacteria bacterium]
MIKIRSLNKSFKGQQVLDSLDLDVPRDKVTVIIGPSGTGKSVLLKHIVGLMKPDSGSIFVDGREITGMNELELNGIRREFGFCFQDAALFDSMNVGQNVGFPIEMHTETPRDKIIAEVGELLKVVGLQGIEAKLPSQLSGGMRKRVGIARALAMRPKILLFDEPTSGLDPVMSNAINSLIKLARQKTGATSLVISHDIEAAFYLADYMAMIYKGKIVFDGKPEDFRNTDNPLVTQFINGRVEGPINTMQL